MLYHNHDHSLHLQQHPTDYPYSYQYTPKTSVQQRPLHWCIILISLLFVFLLVIESVAFVVLGAWHLTSRLVETVNLPFFDEIYHRELAFGIILVLIGAAGIFMSILGLVAFFTLRLLLLRAFAVCLLVVMTGGIASGVVGIVFSSQVNGYIEEMRKSTVVDESYAEAKFMLGMNGGLSLFMSLTWIIGIVIVQCLTKDVNIYASDHIYRRT
ncbi:unnamed protein product [Adineta ricciae]|uniref:Uncharacterized protein n=1 Tax=Adineta ricciae TaxID=249248 RepID=A0A813XF34_ADIRI|nr:unnamed protein product [Adineta ricciae]CAF1109179.1 unnamed protein product [Adineta ricciae]